LRFSGDPNWFIASTSRYAQADTSDDWVVTPKISLTSNNYLYFDTRSGSSTTPDGYEVRISTTDSAVSSFNTTLLTVPSASTTWTSYKIDLSAYANQDVFIAWRNNTYAGYILALDNIEVREVFNRDLELSGINTISGGGDQNIVGTVRNVGLDTITSLYFTYNINNGVNYVDTITNLNLLPNAQIDLSHNVSIPDSFANNFISVKAWTSLPNGMADQKLSNDTVTASVFAVLGNTLAKNPVFEEYTTSVCQFCPDGHVIMARILNNTPTTIPVSVHACFGTDSMTVPEASTICSTLGINAAPTGQVDRKLFEGFTDVAFGRAGGAWDTAAARQARLGSAVDITMNGTYNPGTRQLVMTVTSSFVDYVQPGDLRVSMLIVEDSMSKRGPANQYFEGWDQVNAYYGVQGHPFYQVGTPTATQGLSIIQGYEHRHVLRDILPSTWGDANVIPTNYAINTPYTRTFTVNIPGSMDADQVYLVGAVNYYGGNDISKYEIINAEEVKMSNLPVSLEEVKEVKNSLNIYPNPTNMSFTNVEFYLNENKNVEATLFDLTGKEVYTENYGQMRQGAQRLRLDLANLNNGFYFLNLKIGNEVITRKISVAK
jgi:hypothetical protein